MCGHFSHYIRLNLVMARKSQDTGVRFASIKFVSINVVVTHK